MLKTSLLGGLAARLRQQDRDAAAEDALRMLDPSVTVHP
jgi:hypothetical protein